MSREASAYTAVIRDYKPPGKISHEEHDVTQTIIYRKNRSSLYVF